MKQIAFSLAIAILSLVCKAQVSLPVYPDSLFSTYYHQRLTHFQSLPQTKDDIIFIGNSITDGGEWSELFNDLRLKNRGISGDVSAGIIQRMQEIIDRKPAKIFVLIGTNDLARNLTTDSLLKNIFLIASFLQQEIPSTKLYVQSILPVNDVFKRFPGHTNKGSIIKHVNAALQKNAKQYNYTYIDLHGSFSNKEGKLKKELTNDGLHLSGKGYLDWKHLVYPYVYDLEQRPSLLPLPQQVKWLDGHFPLFACKTILIRDSSSLKEALLLQAELKKKGLQVRISSENGKNEPHIELGLGKVEAPQLPEEAYQLEVSSTRILLKANTAHGIFNGVQTLLQLMRNGVVVDACTISDWPAFSWRGYMVDVGRNYMSTELLKQQIDVMARYKLNIFHFHATEDVAWRIESKLYPQLTAPEYMLRNKGLYYSEAEIKELIAYCQDRHITFVPEIDMPGHSAAFKRAMGYDMQSDSGLIAVKKIVKEFISTYDLPYIHIGADEVKITNKEFLPEVTKLIQGLGKKVIGWEPGGNFSDNTIRQLWMEDIQGTAGKGNIQYIDSRHLYLNHMDPLEAVVTIFNRKIGEKEVGDKNLLGATLCLWHDRIVAKEDDMLQMNPVYPGMIAFSERTWQGGGHKGWTAIIGEPGSGRAKEFAAFESRLLDHRQQYFKGFPFPYTPQSSIDWKIYGPYPNGGDMKAAFPPERAGFDAGKVKPAADAIGGTIVLRHWWYPLIRGVIDQPKDSSTWYATTRIWCEEEAVKPFWIGFNNLSRSQSSDTPPLGSWDIKGSAVFVNGKMIAAPRWKRAGQAGHSEIPLTDEGYEFRSPAQILLKKGWNDVVIKLPVGSFKGRDWHNPVKWMFTFAPLL